MLEEERFMVRAKSSAHNETRYYAFDSMSGWPYWSTFEGEKLTLEGAQAVVEGMMAPNGSDGYPNRDLHEASGTNKTILRAMVDVEIVEIVEQPIRQYSIEAKVTSEEITARKEQLRQQAAAKLSAEEREALGLN